MSNTFLRALDHGGGFEGALRKEALRRFEALLDEAQFSLEHYGGDPGFFGFVDADKIRAIIEAEWLPTGARVLDPVTGQIEVPHGESTQTEVREPG